ncbi:MAG TPA: hypothetical protein VFS76_06095 [Pyrinomonadaceae bacterium]|nr:hypothetical protein [Pyrinomonadaceae bacterium]
MLENLGSTTLKVRPDVFFVRSEDGVWLRNNVGSFFVKGRGSYELVRSLLLKLDGTRTVDDIFAGMVAEKRAALFERLLKPLMSSGFIYEFRPPSSPVPAWIESRYQEHLAFLEQYVDQPVERLLKVRSQPVLCLGSGILLRAVTVALAELGFSRVQVSATEDDSGVLQNVFEGVTRGDEDAEWNLDLHRANTALDQLVSASAAMLPAAGIIVATDSTDHEAIDTTVAKLMRSDATVAVVASVGEFLLASPIMRNDDSCWKCMHRSVVSGQSVTPAPAPAALAAFQVVQRLFCRFAGPPVPEDRYYTTVDCRTLSVQAHQPRQHEACPKHASATLHAVTLDAIEAEQAPIRPDVPASHDPDALVAAQDRIVECSNELTDRVTGPFLSIGEEDLTQLPLSASLCRLRGPNNLPGSMEIKSFECRALAPREARNQVVLLALEWLARAVAKRRAEHARLVAIGAGWSAAEATYRAWATASLERFQSGIESDRLAATELPPTPARTFLLDRLAEHARGSIEMQLRNLATGLTGASVIANGQTIGSGVGVDELHAADHALMDAVSKVSVSSTCDLLGTSYPAPALYSWRDVLSRINDRATERYSVLEIRDLLPFLAGRAWIVGLAADEPAEGGAAA